MDLDWEPDTEPELELELEPVGLRELKGSVLSDESAGIQKREPTDWSRPSSSNEFHFQPYCEPLNGSQQNSLDRSPSFRPNEVAEVEQFPSSKTLESPSDSNESMELSNKTGAHLTELPKSTTGDNLWELRLLVRRREAGALIGKRGSNIKRLRDNYRSCMLSIPDTGNGPERIACILADRKSMASILTDMSELLLEKSLDKDDQIELKLLIHSSQAGSIIGMGGQTIKKLRNESKAAIKIYELCCPYSNERVCAIKAKPPVVVSTIQLLQAILNENPAKGPLKPYDASHFDPMLSDKYGGYLPEESLELLSGLGSLPSAFDSAAAMQAYSRLTEAAALQSSYQHMAHQHHQQLVAAIDQSTRHNHYHRMLYQQQKQANNTRATEQDAEQVSRERRSASSDANSQPTTGADSDRQHQNQTGKANMTRQARFHPYIAESRIPSMHQVSRFSSYEPFIRMQPALFQQQLSLSGLSQAPGLNRCRHLRPCICMLMQPATTTRRLQPFTSNLVNYTPPNATRLAATTTKDAACFGVKKK